MEAVILAAGKGSRMGNITQKLPKIFVDIAGRELYHHQIERLSPYCDRITVILGYGFESKSNPITEFSLENIGQDTDIEFKVIEDWENKENAYTAFIGLSDLTDDVLLVCGDVIFTQQVIDRIVTRFHNKLKPNEFSGVGVVEGIQDEMTGVRWGENEIITQYGAIESHQEIGVFALHEDHLTDARKILNDNHTDWFPIIFQKIPSKPLPVEEEKRHEINTPQHLSEAREKWEKLSAELPSER
jgi:choline kinase